MKHRRSLPLSLRYAVWNTWQGGPGVGSGPCHVCNRLITQQDYECGHVIPHSAGGMDIVSNMRPICRSCNRSMGAVHLDVFRCKFFPVNSVPFDPPPPPVVVPATNSVRPLEQVHATNNADGIENTNKKNPFARFACCTLKYNGDM